MTQYTDPLGRKIKISRPEAKPKLKQPPEPMPCPDCTVKDQPNDGGDYFSKTEIEVKLFWAVWMNMATAENNHAGPAREADVDAFIADAKVRNPKLHFWKVPLGGQLPWRDELEMHEAYMGKKLR